LVFFAAKQKDRGSKNNNNYKTARNSNSCTRNTLESKIDIALAVYTCQTKINGTSHTSRDW